ncbi:TrkA C-terminal domain-containing protein, partial [Bacillus safensis]|nr:TrkA C-terminal domain-containing protein [Bacillus safensis]
RITKTSTMIGKRVTDLIKAAEGEAMVTSIVRKEQRLTPLPDTVLNEGDVVLLEGAPKALAAIISAGKLTLSENRNPSETSGSTDIEAVEAVIGKNSRLIGLTAQRLALFARDDLNLLA